MPQKTFSDGIHEPLGALFASRQDKHTEVGQGHRQVPLAF